MMNRANHRASRRRGSIYVAVLGFSMLAAVLAIGSVLASRVQMRSAGTASDMAQARINAQSAIELTKWYIYTDPTWRTDQPNGNWATGLSAGGGTFSVNVVDPIDGDLTNRPHDPITMTATAYYGKARQILTESLTATPTPLPILQCAISTADDFRLSNTSRMVLGTGTLCTAGQYRSDSSTFMEGNVCYGTAKNVNGITYGAFATNASTPTFPAASIGESYAKLGTLITLSSTTIANQVLGPGYNPWGTANADGVYVIRPNADLLISNTRVYGTLVIINSGHQVILDSKVFFQKYRSDYPALIIVGDCTMQFTSPNNSLSEASTGTNFNPVGVPYNGITDNDLTDTYPSEIDGLVHITGQLTVSQPCLIRGALICSSTTSSLTLTASQMQVIYDPTLYTNPPQYYTTQVQMTPQTGTWTPTVN